MFAFVRPRAQFNRYIQNVPLNYIHLAAWLRRAGREVHILDMVIDGVTRIPSICSFVDGAFAPSESAA
ncbi:MAG TPA: hypothetical protein VH640_26710 [Bryobacteraceae bacterium]|jgi:hypothetical protein